MKSRMPSPDDLLKEARAAEAGRLHYDDDVVLAMLRAAIAYERKACAEIARSITPKSRWLSERIAEAIEARGK
jgi:hypothetical protein